MLRCPKCKQWLKNITTDFDVKYDGNIIHAIHVPAKIMFEMRRNNSTWDHSGQNYPVCFSKK